MKEEEDAKYKAERKAEVERMLANGELLPAEADRIIREGWLWVGEIRYERSSERYLIFTESYLDDEPGSWTKVSEKAARRFLKDHGIFDGDIEKEYKRLHDKEYMYEKAKRFRESHHENVEDALSEIRGGYVVDFSGPRAGFIAGQIIQENGEKFMVTSSPKRIEPAEGDFPTITQLLDGMFPETKIYFLAWMKEAVDALPTGERRTGKALVMAGPANSGKSFIQNHLITPILGGRVAEPHMFMSGGTTFSDSLPAAEHWKIEDQGNPTPKGRKAMEISIKQATANEGVTHHPKGKALKSVQAFRRLSISCNDDPESLRILPKMNNSLMDKMLILAASKGGIPEDHGDPEKQKAYRTKIYAELPAFLHHLRSLIIDPKYKGRFGVADYHVPEIMRKLNALVPAHQVCDLIDEEFKDIGAEDCVQGTAGEIFELFTRVAKQMNALCKGSTRVFGRHLSDLVRDFPDRFKSRMLDGKTIYTISFP